LNGISKDQVSRICKELDGQVHAFRTRPLRGDYPYLMLDATFEKVREHGRVVCHVNDSFIATSPPSPARASFTGGSHQDLRALDAGTGRDRPSLALLKLASRPPHLADGYAPSRQDPRYVPTSEGRS